ncbi:hypothetical protein DPEC_G00237750 [Dallia pectoralis]|uniref:Uncharacterized protein n=1 Tax=Dallia pectoralis TaxID=75939 RepID=A0ACC2FYU4_DALPE|nr:hypothetical protein DPEC_G00237750 [Dallia pectoralis]
MVAATAGVLASRVDWLGRRCRWRAAGDLLQWGRQPAEGVGHSLDGGAGLGRLIWPHCQWWLRAAALLRVSRNRLMVSAISEWRLATARTQCRYSRCRCLVFCC